MEQSKNKVATCKRCGQPIVFYPNDAGWVHKDGGVYVQKCLKCGWTGGKVGSYQKCPNCGESKRLIDDHYVQPH